MSQRAVSSQQLAMFLTPDELSQMKANDFGGRLMRSSGHLRRAMAERHQSDSPGEPYRGGVGGPGPYLARLKDSIERQGGIAQPIHVYHDPEKGPTLLDGHHRSAVAMETGRLVPVVHHDETSNKKEGRQDMSPLEAALTSAFYGRHASTSWSGDPYL